MDLGGHPAAVTASDGAPNGDALVWVVVVGLGFHAIEDGGEGAGEEALRREKAWLWEAKRGMPRWAMAMRGAKGHGVSMPQLSCGTGGRLRTSRGCGHPGIKRATRAVEAVAGGRRSVARYSKTIAGCLVWRAAYE